jgi:Fe-S cluster biogenesis protein NfuA
MEKEQGLQTTVEEKIRPILDAYRANVELVEVTTDKFLKVKVTGTCVTCHGAQQRIAEMIEKAFKEVVCPDFNGVILVQQASNNLMEETLNFFRKDPMKRCRYAISAR